MSHRTSANSSESLELLLDTICNTFGAVIFISMLVAILVSRSSPKSADVQRHTDIVARTAVIQAEVREAENRLRVLSRQLRQQELIASRFASPESLALAKNVMQQSEEHLATMERKSAAVVSLTDTNAATAILQEKIQREQDAFEAEEAENRHLRSEVDRQQKLAGRTARIPRVRRTNKESCVYALDDGRLFRVTTPNQTIDDVDCERRSDRGSEEIRPRPSGGLPISQGAETEINRRFAGVSSKEHFVQLFVSRDSFAEFLPVKNALVESGFEYEVVITENNDVVLMLGPTTRESFVQ